MNQHCLMGYEKWHCWYAGVFVQSYVYFCNFSIFYTYSIILKSIYRIYFELSYWTHSNSFFCKEEENILKALFLNYYYIINSTIKFQIKNLALSCLEKVLFLKTHSNSFCIDFLKYFYILFYIDKTFICFSFPWKTKIEI